MPEMDGLEATRHIRAAEKNSGRHIPIIAMTANVTPEDQRICTDAGMDGFLGKPVRSDEMLQALARYAGAAHGTTTVALTTSSIRDEVFDIQDALQRLDGNADLLRTVCRSFLDRLAAVCAPIQEALDQRDAESLRKAAHGIKGALLNVSAPRAAAVALTLEHCGRDAQLDAALEHWKELQQELTLLTPKMAAYCAAES